MNLFSMVTTSYSERYTWLALETFFQHTPFNPGDRFILFDNDRTFDQAELGRRFPQVEFTAHSRPHSFAANVNLALAQARTARAPVFFLNNDLVFTPNWLAPLMIESRAIISPVCNMQYNYQVNQLTCRLSMDLDDYLGKENDLLALVERHSARVTGYKLEHSFPYYCVKIPPSVYEAVGDFDESYGFAGWEDSDYTLRCYLAGIPIYFSLGSFILHFYGKSSWRVEADSSVRDKLLADNLEGKKVFEQRWGSKLVELFCLQKPEAVRQLRAAEERNTIKLYGDIIRAHRPA